MFLGELERLAAIGNDDRLVPFPHRLQAHVVVHAAISQSQPVDAVVPVVGCCTTARQVRRLEVHRQRAENRWKA